MILIVLVCFRVYICSIFLFLRQLFTSLGLKIVAEDDQKLEGVEYGKYNIYEHVAVVESAETAP